MSRVLALIDGDQVANVILGEPGDYPGALDITAAAPRPGPGWTFDGSAFAPPSAEPVTPPRDFVPAGEFMDRWTTAELAAFYAAKKTDPILDAFDGLVSRIGGVRLGSERALGGKAYLVNLGILTAARADAVFAP